jgi:hypothetical protein
MKLFDDHASTDYLPSSPSEPVFSYLSRSTRVEFAAARALLQAWFDRYPAQHHHELRSRIRSPINRDHFAAVMEIALHELLLALGGEVSVHPPLSTTSRRPDFLVQDQAGRTAYIEAALVTFRSAGAEAAEARKNVVYDVINRRLNAPEWFLWLEVSGSPTSQPPARQIVAYLADKLRHADSAAIASAYELGGLDGLPAWPFASHGWSILFRPIPRRSDFPHDPHHRPLGMFSTGFEFVDHRSALRDAIIDKACAYGDLEYPFVVAVHPLEDVDDIDITEALFGKEQYLVGIPELGSDVEPQVIQSRVMDGVWTHPTGPRNTQLSAVLLMRSLFPWAINSSSARLYHNPWASSPYDSLFCQLPQAIPRDGSLHKEDGISLAHLLLGDTGGSSAA